MKIQPTPTTPVAAAVTTTAVNTSIKTAVKIAPATSGQQRLWYQCEMLHPPYSYNEQLEDGLRETRHCCFKRDYRDRCSTPGKPAYGV